VRAAFSPIGYTPTDVALAAVRSARLFDLVSDTQAGRPKVVVLVTDGEPNDCDPSKQPLGVATRIGETLAEAAQLAELGVPTYVLGFPGVNTQVMQAMAYAGDPSNAAAVPNLACSTRYCSATGSGARCGAAPTAPDCLCDDDPTYSGVDGYTPSGCLPYARLPGTYYPVSDTATITAAFQAILSRTAGCSVGLSATRAGSPDASVVTVEIVAQGGAARSAVAADPVNGYVLAGSTVTLRGAACDALQAAARSDTSAHVAVREGCACVASSEQCGDQRDNDCDGRIDEGCTPVSVCGADASATECSVGECAAPEVCNGHDDDCDGTVDEGCPVACPAKASEVCNGRDDDCDGTVDEGCPVGCAPTPEICDGRDNDCDGVVDGDCALCRPWLEICDGEDNDCDGLVDDACLSCPLPSNEVCDGEDNDCDGTVDEGCPSEIVL